MSLGKQPEPGAPEGSEGSVLLMWCGSVVRGQGSLDGGSKSDQKTGAEVVYSVSLSDPLV